MKRAAVLIGVQEVKGLTKLHAVHDGVDRMEQWALDQGMERKLVRTITDKNGQVKADDVEEAMIETLGTDGLEQLIIYFAGHGVNVSYNEYWLLTHAVDRPNQSVNVFGSLVRAKNCGVSHVVFLSDACRSAPQSVRGLGTNGSIMFPNPPAGANRTYVDMFYATSLGEPALEIKDTQSAANLFRAAYTDALLEAVNGLHTDICELDYELGQKVVRPWALGDFLEQNVPERVYELTNSLKVTQVPRAEILSRPNSAWISDVSKAKPSSSITFHSSQETSRQSSLISDEMQSANDLISDVLRDSSVTLMEATERVRGGNPALETVSDDDLNFGGLLAQASEDVFGSFERQAFETECGFKAVSYTHLTLPTKRIV